LPHPGQQLLRTPRLLVASHRKACLWYLVLRTAGITVNNSASRYLSQSKSLRLLPRRFPLLSEDTSQSDRTHSMHLQTRSTSMVLVGIKVYSTVSMAPLALVKSTSLGSQAATTGDTSASTSQPLLTKLSLVSLSARFSTLGVKSILDVQSLLLAMARTSSSLSLDPPTCTRARRLPSILQVLGACRPRTLIALTVARRRDSSGMCAQRF
ncbi:hypothetical protein J4E82_011740, partial [Alternaria postmessia]|uniref:uncharacterized protein n=1 Tax=Alternaria postmessia TaxID=1187938 RepID=UPI0022247DD8